MKAKTCALTVRQFEFFQDGGVRLRKRLVGTGGAHAGPGPIDLTDEKNQKWLLGFSDRNPFRASAAGDAIDVRFDGSHYSATVNEIWVEADERAVLWAVAVIVPTPEEEGAQ